MSDDPNTVHKPGDVIGNPSASDDSDSGSLGCFARNTADGSAVLLSCAHVLFANLTDSSSLAIYSPATHSTCCSHRQIASTLRSWEEGFGPLNNAGHASAVSMTAAGDATTYNGWETDAAIAQLQPNVLYSNEIPGGLGMITGVPASGIGVPAGPAWGTPWTDAQVVRFFSPLTGRVHYGTLVPPDHPGTYTSGGSGAVDPLRWPYPAFDSSDAASNARGTIGALLVLPRPGPGETYANYRSRPLIFGQPGDSGSVVVNNAMQVVGILVRSGAHPRGLDDPAYFAAWQQPEWVAANGVGWIVPIQLVLNRLNIEIPASYAQTTMPSTSAVAFGVPSLETAAEYRLERGRQRIADALRTSRMGKLLLGKIAQHRVEARRIVLGNRRAQVVWQRHQGPSFIRHCVENMRDSTHRIPTSINGVARADFVHAIAAILARYGSPSLVRDATRFERITGMHGMDVTTLDEVPRILAGLRRPHGTDQGMPS